MSRYPRMESKKEPDLYVMELSRGQLILLICVSLFLALTFFGAGVQVGRIDQMPARQAASDPSLAETATETYSMPLTAVGTTEGESLPAAPGQSSALDSGTLARRTAESPPRSPFMENRPRLTELPPLPSARPAVPATAPTVVHPEAGEGEPVPTSMSAVPAPQVTANTPVSPVSVPAVTPVASPATASAEPLSPLLAQLDPVTPPPAFPAATATPVTPATPAAPAVSTAPTPGKFGVQLGAFSGNDRKSRAEAFQRQVRERHGLRAEILPSEDQKNYRVVVTGFADRNAAEAACRDIKNKPGLTEVFVRAL